MNLKAAVSSKPATNLQDWIDQLSSSFLRISSDGVVIYANASARTLLGARIRGANLFDFLAVDGIASRSALLNELSLAPSGNLQGVPVRLLNRAAAAGTPGAHPISGSFVIDHQSGDITVMLQSGWAASWASAGTLYEAAQQQHSALQPVLDECAYIAGTRTGAQSAFLLSMREGEIAIHATWHRIGPSSNSPSSTALAAAMHAVQKSATRRIHSSGATAIAVPVSFSSHETPPLSAALLTEGGPCGLHDQFLLQALSHEVAPLWALLGASRDANSAYEELLQEVRAMPDLGLLQDAIHDAKNYVRDSVGAVESIHDELRKHLSADQVTILVNSIASLRQSRDLLADMLKDWSAPSLSQAGQPGKSVDLVEVTHRVESLLKGAAGPGISFRYGVRPKDAVLVFGSKAQVLVLIYHLVSNAVKALKTRTGAGVITINLKQKPGTAIRKIEIADNGPGFPPSLRDQFNRRNPLPGGTGRGLSQVRSIVEALGGKISLDSTLSVGSRFKIELSGPIVR